MKFLPRFVCAMAVLFALLVVPWTASAEAPAILVAPFQARVEKTAITMSDIDTPIRAMLGDAQDTFFTELAGDPRYRVLDFTSETTRLRLDEAALMGSLGDGVVPPELTPAADYVACGYLTHLSNVKAQSGVLVLSGKDKTVYAELSLRIIDMHTGTVVFTTKADSRRKAELTYHVVVHRDDVGAEDAIRQAIEDAATNLAADVRAAI
ncbi:hypothetical protein [uncultured Selenomonas sp.]|uniref:hypothetical protein n=1 Tax=uncultured Selenomonas sp. TaxID=159275 RepID=UPI0025CC3365|nr:hypothetical protein [uncultured Selenomonas sp.]